jgi:hypothetical protein
MTKVKTQRLKISTTTRLVGRILKAISMTVFLAIWLYAVYHIVFVYQSNFGV